MIKMEEIPRIGNWWMLPGVIAILGLLGALFLSGCTTAESVTDGVATLDKAFSGTIAAIANIIPLMIAIVVLMFIVSLLSPGNPTYDDGDDEEDDCDEEDDVELRCEYCKSRNVPPCETCHACGAPLR